MKQGHIDQREIYQEWVAARRKARVPEGFSGRVMETIQHRADRNRLRRAMGGFQDLYLPAQWPKRLALLGSLFALGVFRVTYITANLLLP